MSLQPRPAKPLSLLRPLAASLCGGHSSCFLWCMWCHLHKVPVVTTEPSGQIMDVDFPKVSIASMPSQPNYPPDAKANRVQGKVVLEVTVNALGVPESVTPIEGPGPLLTYAMGWAMRWRYKPLEANGNPIRVRFPLLMDFRLQ